jgi:tetratricopeptide (TPR) repeat protein
MRNYVNIVLLHLIWMCGVTSFTSNFAFKSRAKLSRQLQIPNNNCFSSLQYTPLLTLCMSSRGNEQNSDNDKNIPKIASTSISAASRARREEDASRERRKSDVVLGKTSAIRGAQDYPLDSKATEELWMKYASNLEQQIYRQTEIAMDQLRLLQVEESVLSFDRIFQLKPQAYCWQAGIAKFYSADYAGAAKVLSDCAVQYESKFGTPASEERIWLDASALKHRLASGEESHDRQADTTIETSMQNLILPPTSTVETRRVFRIVRELFTASVNDDNVGVALSRAKLRSIAGRMSQQPDPKLRVDRKMWKLTSWFYLGLHYDVLGQIDESKNCMKMALQLCPNSKGDDIIHLLPMLHMSRRDWFDDDELTQESEDNVEELLTSRDIPADLPLGIQTKDPIIIASIFDSISTLKLQQLKEALKARGLAHSGSKNELRLRLFHSLVSDVGLDL